MRHVSFLLLITLLFSCKHPGEPKVDLCQYEGDTIHCYPKNQPDKQEYDRALKMGDIVISIKDYGEIKKHHEDLHSN